MYAESHLKNRFELIVDATASTPDRMYKKKCRNALLPIQHYGIFFSGINYVGNLFKLRFKRVTRLSTR